MTPDEPPVPARRHRHRHRRPARAGHAPASDAGGPAGPAAPAGVESAPDAGLAVRRGPSWRRRRRTPVLRVRMRFAWWQLGVAALCMVLAGWVVMILQPWHPR